MYHFGVPELLIFTGVRLADEGATGTELLLTFALGTNAHLSLMCQYRARRHKRQPLAARWGLIFQQSTTAAADTAGAAPAAATAGGGSLRGSGR